MGKLLKIAFILYSLTILFLSFYPVPETPTPDKLNHMIAFFLFSVLLKLSFKTGYWSTVFYSLIFGVFIEFVQYFIPYRSAEYGDVVADLTGTLIGIFSYFLLDFLYIELNETKQ